MLFNICIGLIVLLAIFLIFVATRPSIFTVTRSAVIPAAPQTVFALVNSFHEWDRWSPWAKLDPNCKNSFDGAKSGVGAKFAWDGNREVGAGRMEITDSRPDAVIMLDLVFIRPMEGTNLTVFDFEPDGNGTRVTWTMSGPVGFMGKLFGVLMNCEKMVGCQFEKGLNNIRQIVSGNSAP